MASVKCRIHVKNKIVPKTLTSSDWEEKYKTLIEYVERKVKGTHLQDFHILVEKIPIDSHATFKQVVDNMKQNEVHVYIKVCELYTFLEMIHLHNNLISCLHMR